MAPPEALREIIVDFCSIESYVAENIGKRIRLQFPSGIILCIGRRWRDIPAQRREGPPDECARIALMLCCSEPLKFIGSLIAANAGKPVKNEKRYGRIMNWSVRSKSSQGSSSSDGSFDRDVDDAVMGTVAVAAAPILNSAVVHAGRNDLPAYRQPPELYVGSSGKIFIYLRLSRTDAISCVAENVDMFVKRGIVNVYLPVQRPIACHSLAARELVECRSCNDAVSWRERHLARHVILGDKTEISVCDNIFLGYDMATLEKWAAEADVNAVDVIAFVSNPLSTPPFVVLTDNIGRVYLVQGASSLSIVADDLFEFIERGVKRYDKNFLFMGDPLEASLTRTGVCHNGFQHHAATNGIPHGSQPVWIRKKKSRSASFRDTMTRIIGSFKKK